MAEQQQQEQTQQKGFVKKQPVFINVNELRIRQHCRNVYVQVQEVEITQEENRDIQVAKGYVSDNTGYISFIVRGKFAQLFKRGAFVAFRNLKSVIVEGQHTITIDQWGKITEEQQSVSDSLTKPLLQQQTIKLINLVPGENNQNVLVKIQKVEHSTEQTKRHRDENVAIGVCGDDSAIINFKVWGRFAKMIEQGKSYIFLNSLSQVDNEIHRLASGNRGCIQESKVSITIPNQPKDMSAQRYERVVIDEQDNRQQRKGSRNFNNRNDRNDRNNNRRQNDNRGNNNRRQNDNRGNRDNRDNRDNNRNNNRDNNRNNNRGRYNNE